MIEGDNVLRADVLQFEIDSVKGVVFGGNLEGGSSQFLMSGDTIQKTGKETYVFDKGEFTSCKCPEGEREPWALTAGKADLDMSGYGTARNTTFEVLGRPGRLAAVDDLPAEEGPRDRLPVPDVRNASSRNGFDVGLPFFWAVGERLNLTFTASYLTENGFMPSVEGEYVFGEKSRGAFYGACDRRHEHRPGEPVHAVLLPALGARPPPRPVPARTTSASWSTPASSRTTSTPSTSTSSRRSARTASSSRRPSSRSASARSTATASYGAIQYADDQQNPDNQDRDKFLLQRLPQLHASGVPQKLDKVLPGLVGSFDVDYANF